MSDEQSKTKLVQMLERDKNSLVFCCGRSLLCEHWFVLCSLDIKYIGYREITVQPFYQEIELKKGDETLIRLMISRQDIKCVHSNPQGWGSVYEVPGTNWKEKYLTRRKAWIEEREKYQTPEKFIKKDNSKKKDKNPKSGAGNTELVTGIDIGTGPDRTVETEIRNGEVISAKEVERPVIIESTAKEQDHPSQKKWSDIISKPAEVFESEYPVTKEEAFRNNPDEELLAEYIMRWNRNRRIPNSEDKEFIDANRNKIRRLAKERKIHGIGVRDLEVVIKV